MSLSGKVAIVTGASRGIGEAIARHLAMAGASVVVAARSEESRNPLLPGTIHSVAEAITAAGGIAHPVRLDIGDPDSIAACVAETVARFGRLDIVVNNAAIFVPGAIGAVTPKHLDLLYKINLRGPILLIGEALPHLGVAGGHVVNVSSGSAALIGPGPYPDSLIRRPMFYAMLKAGLDRLTQSLAMELADQSIAVNSLSVRRSIRTPGNIYARQDPDNPVLQFGAADDMGACVVEICGRPFSYTGHIVIEDGSRLAREA